MAYRQVPLTSNEYLHLVVAGNRAGCLFGGHVKKADAWVLFDEGQTGGLRVKVEDGMGCHGGVGLDS